MALAPRAPTRAFSREGSHVERERACIDQLSRWRSGGLHLQRIPNPCTVHPYYIGALDIAKSSQVHMQSLRQLLTKLFRRIRLNVSAVAESAGKNDSNASSDKVISTGVPKTVVVLRNERMPLSVENRKGTATPA